MKLTNMRQWAGILVRNLCVRLLSSLQFRRPFFPAPVAWLLAHPWASKVTVFPPTTSKLMMAYHVVTRMGLMPVAEDLAVNLPCRPTV